MKKSHGRFFFSYATKYVPQSVLTTAIGPGRRLTLAAHASSYVFYRKNIFAGKI
jgi:hypothetical protein